jgi:hypothetical protein
MARSTHSGIIKQRLRAIVTDGAGEGGSSVPQCKHNDTSLCSMIHQAKKKQRYDEKRLQ